MSDPGIAHYIARWPREGDFGVVAEDRGSTIGVVAQRRGEGVGRLLLEGMAREADRRGITRISLSVEADNPALHLYAAVGFVEVSRVGDTPTMVLDCRRHERRPTKAPPER